MTETELLLTHIRRCRRVDLYVDAPPLSELERNILLTMKKRRKEGIPLQYLVGKCEFAGHSIFVDERVLIPRPETELLAEEAIKECRQRFSPEVRILDIGTGSGALAVSLAAQLPQGRITAVDISQPALDLAGENARINSVFDRILFLCSDVFSVFDYSLGDRARFDLIISNPPYIPSGELRSLPADVQNEPVLALNGGEDGLDFYRRIIGRAVEFLREGGILMMEFGDGQTSAIKQIIARTSQFQNVRFHKDLNGKPRFFIAEFTSHG